MSTQDNWRLCANCLGLYYNGNPTNGVCPAMVAVNDTHLEHVGYIQQGGIQSVFNNYILTMGSARPNTTDQGGWRWCHKCAGMWYADSSFGACPVGGAHSSLSSGDYVLTVSNVSNNPLFEEGNWRWCHKCNGLWFTGMPAKGVCPGWKENLGESHEEVGSGPYVLLLPGIIG